MQVIIRTPRAEWKSGERQQEISYLERMVDIELATACHPRSVHQHISLRPIDARKAPDIRRFVSLAS